MKLGDRRPLALDRTHTAFDDPTSPANAGFRESIEIRTLAFF